MGVLCITAEFTVACKPPGAGVGPRCYTALYRTVATSTEDEVGFSCGTQGSLHAEDCELRSFSCGAVFNVEDGGGWATCKLDRCSFVDSNRTATKQAWRLSGVSVYLGGGGAHMSMNGCTVSGVYGDCLGVSCHAKATLEGCQLSHSHTDCIR